MNKKRGFSTRLEIHTKKFTAKISKLSYLGINKIMYKDNLNY